MPTFVGLDLAWTARNETGICWFEGETPADLTCTRIGACVRGAESLSDELAALEGSVIVTNEHPFSTHPNGGLNARLPGASVDTRRPLIKPTTL